MQTAQKKNQINNCEGQKTLECKEKKHRAQMIAGAELGGGGLFGGAVQCRSPLFFPRHCSLPRSTGHTLISHVCQQHE